MKNKIRFLAMMLIGVLLSVNQVWGADDFLTYDAIGLGYNSGQSGDATYVDFSDVSVTSSAQYAGNIAKFKTSSVSHAGTIQMRTTNSNSGIVTTASGGKATKVVVSWNSETTNGRTIDIYGKNSAYTQATDLYSSDASTKGTKLGSIVCGTSTTLNIDGDYAYIGIRSNSSALYLNNITITWGSSITYTDYLTDCATTWNVTIAKNEETWGTVSQASVTAVADQTTVSASSNVLTIGTTEVAATAAEQTAQYTYAFSNWTGIPSSGKITEDVTITANFTRTARTYSVTYKDQGGGDYSGNNAGSLVANYTYGTGATLVAGTKYGFNFEGWYDNQGCTGSPVTTISNSTTGDKTYYAKWSENLNCNWVIKGSWDGWNDTDHRFQKPTGQSTSSTGSVTITIASAEIYEFKLRQTDGTPYDCGADYTYEETKVIGDDVTLCSNESKNCKINAKVQGDYTFTIDYSDNANCPKLAVQYPDYVTVTFNMQGHGDAIASKYCVPGGTVSAPADPTADAYVFGGWYENASCTGDAFNFNTTLNADKTLYAKWTFQAPTYYYRGSDNSWGATEMTPSADHLYSYFAAKGKDNLGSNNNFLIQTLSTGGTIYGGDYLAPGFNGTNITNMGKWDEETNACIYNAADFYIIVYYPNTAINSSSDPKICASTSLPGNFYVDGGAKLYFDNTLGNWAEGKQHLRIGRSDHSTAVPMTKVTGTANLYECTVPAYNNYFAFTVANSAGWTGIDNTIYQPSDKQPTEEYAITEELVYQNYLLDVDYTLLPTSKGSTDKGCTYINTNHEPGMKMQNVSITEYSHGTVNVAYTDIDGSNLNFTTGNRNVAHTCILTITATPETGARLVSLKVNGNNFTSGQTFVANATTEITAVFSNEWTLTWDYAGGTVVSAGTAAGSVAYGTTLTAPILKKTGYDFNGWNPTVPATMPAANSTYTAQWTLAQYTINPLNLTGCSVTGTAWPTETKAYGSSFSTTISANDGYNLPSEISVTGATYTWIAETGVLTITSVIGDVTVSIVAVEKTYVNYRTSCTTVTTVTLNKGDHGTADGSATIKLGTSTFSSWTGVEAAAHFDLIGYYADDIKVIDENGTLVSNVSGWTTDGKWDKDATTATLTAKFKQRTYTVTLNDNGVIIESPKVNEGESYTLPPLSCESDDFEKVGWTKTAPVNNGWASKPTLAGATVSEGGTYYAVYGEGSGDPNTFVKVTSSAGFESGATYMYVWNKNNEGSLYGMSNSFSTDHFNPTEALTETNSRITNSASGNRWIITEQTTGYYSIQNVESSKYIGTNEYDISRSTTEVHPWQLTWDGSHIIFYCPSCAMELGGYTFEYYLQGWWNGDNDPQFGLQENYYDYGTCCLYKQEGTMSYISNPDCRTITGIEIITPPTKVTYNEEETFNPAGLVIRVTYDEGYPINVPYSGNESSFSFSPDLTTPLTTSDASVRVTYGGFYDDQTIMVNALTRVDVRFYNNGTQVGTTRQVIEGRAIGELPTPSDFSPALVSCDDESTTFVGWSEATIMSTEKQHTSPTIITSADIIDEAKSYNAVWASGTAALGNKSLTKANVGATTQAYTADPVGISSDGYTWTVKAYRESTTSGMIQMRARTHDAGVSYIQLPEFGSNIDYITFSVTSTGTDAGKTEGGAVTNTKLMFQSGATKDETTIAESENTNSTSRTITLPAASAYTTGYITAGAGIRIWNVTVHFKGSYDNFMTTCCENKVAAPVVDDATKTHNSITLSWSNVDGATGYKVTINGATHDVTTGSPSYTASGLTPNTAYSWTVVATWDSEGAYCGAIPAIGSTTTNPLYTLTITDTEGVYNIKANGSQTKTQSFAAGTEITLSGTTRNGYIFGEWVVKQGETPITVTDNKFTMPAANVTVTATFTAKKDYYVDDMNDNAQIVKEGQYTVPSLPDVVAPSSSNSCEQTHLYFVGWIEGEIGSGQEEEPTGLIKAGDAGTAKEKTYHAVWAEDANSNQ